MTDPSPSLGILCPACGFPLSHVIWTRPKLGSIHRKRKCDDCGETFATIETPPTSPNLTVVDVVEAALEALKDRRT